MLRSESALEEVSVAAVSAIEALSVDPVQPLHARGKSRPRRLDEQVHVVAHQAIRVEEPVEAVDDVAEVSEVVTPVDAGAVDRAAVDTTSGDVRDQAGGIEAEAPWHLTRKYRGPVYDAACGRKRCRVVTIFGNGSDPLLQPHIVQQSRSGRSKGV